MAEHDRSKKLAILIDAENASPRISRGLFEEVALLGEASVRRIYGDFSCGRLKGWSEILSAYAIVPQQHFANIAGKNASDIALVIDAMDLLHSGRFDGFCLVSSDSDFTRLAARIREQGIDVYGVGERKTPESFRKACKRFIYTEDLTPVLKAEVVPVPVVEPAAAMSTSAKQPVHAATIHIRAAVSQLEHEDGWYCLGAIGSRLGVLTPGFDPRTYGCPKLVTLIEKLDAFDIRRIDLSVYVRLKESVRVR